jgi:hypothetical protein
VELLSRLHLRDGKDGSILAVESKSPVQELALSEASGLGLWELVVALVFCSWCGGRWRWRGCGGSGKFPADVPSSSSIPAARCFLRFFKAALLRTGPVWLWLGGALVAFVFAGFQVVPLFVDNRLCGGSSFFRENAKDLRFDALIDRKKVICTSPRGDQHPALQLDPRKKT